LHASQDHSQLKTGAMDDFLPRRFALDTVTQEPYVCTPQLDESKMKKILHNPAHPLTIAANIVW